MPKIDQKKRREYWKQLNVYSTTIYNRLQARKLTEERFWMLQDKITQWYENYKPLKSTPREENT